MMIPKQAHNKINRILLVTTGGLLLLLLAGVGVISAAPSSQGTVPPLPTVASPPPPLTAVPGVPGSPKGNDVLPTPVPPTPQPPPFRGACCLPGVVFNSTRDGNLEIYVMRSDGTGATRLTLNPAIDRHPAASLDGARLAFESTRDDADFTACGQPGKPNCVTHIYAMNVDGSAQTRLTNGAWQDTAPSWSAGGTRIVFVSNRDDPDPLTCGQPGKSNCVTNLYMMNADGSGATRLNPANAPAANTDPSWSPDDTRVAFASTRDDADPLTCGQPAKPNCVSHLYVVQFDGSNLTRLTDAPATDGHPAWSPDGARLVFQSNRDGRVQLYLVNADGSNSVRLTNAPADDVHPIWIPGCADRIVFASNRDANHFGIYAIDPDGSNLTRLTTPAAGVDDDFPAWSGLPAALQLPGPCCVPGVAFSSLRDGNSEIYLMRADGSRVTRLTFNPAIDRQPAPSPDGTRLAFESNRDGRFQLYVMNVDGSGTTRVTNSAGDDTAAAWSNDGTRIAFQSSRSGAAQIYVMNADGSGVTQLTRSASTVTNEQPAWSPDNRRIAFVSNRDGNAQVYLMNADGSGVTRLTNDSAQDGHPSFSADGKRVVFESNRDGKYQIYGVNVDGSNPTRLTNDAADDRFPVGCPSCSDRIVFESNRDGVNSIYAMNADGSAQVRLTIPPGGSAGDEFPAWAGLPIRLPVPVYLPPLAAAAPAPARGSDGLSALLDWLNNLIGRR